MFPCRYLPTLKSRMPTDNTEVDDNDFAALTLAMEKSAKMSSGVLPEPDVDASRFEVRRAEQDATDEEAEDAENSVDSANTSKKVWMSMPGVRDQLQRYPDTVRLGAPVTAIFNLSENPQLVEWNALQSKTAGDAPTVAIISHESNFYNGAYWIHVTYKPIQYQKL